MIQVSEIKDLINKLTKPNPVERKQAFDIEWKEIVGILINKTTQKRNEKQNNNDKKLDNQSRKVTQ